MKILLLLLFAAAPQYRQALPGYRYQFPRDHFEHPDFRSEWWYYTGNVHARDGHRYGFELVFFRQGERMGDPANPSVWRIDDLYLAHLALTDIDGRRFRYYQRLNRAGPGVAGARAGHAGTRTVEAPVVAEAPAIDIGQRQVRQIQVVDAPDGRVGGVSHALALAEEDQLEAVAVTVPRVHVAGVIPPFAAEIGVLEVVARKLVAVAGQRLPVLGRRGEKEQQQDLHGSDSSGKRVAAPAFILSHGPSLLSW